MQAPEILTLHNTVVKNYRTTTNELFNQHVMVTTKYLERFCSYFVYFFIFMFL